MIFLAVIIRIKWAYRRSKSSVGIGMILMLRCLS